MIRIYRYSMILAAAALALTACSTEEPRSQWQPERGRIYLQFPTGDEATVQGEEAGTGSESRVETADVFIYDGEQCLHYERLSIPQNGAPVPLSQVLATDFVVGQPYEVHVVANYRDGEDGNASFPEEEASWPSRSELAEMVAVTSQLTSRTESTLQSLLMEGETSAQLNDGTGNLVEVTVPLTRAAVKVCVEVTIGAPVRSDDTAADNPGGYVETTYAFFGGTLGRLHNAADRVRMVAGHELSLAELEGHLVTNEAWTSFEVIGDSRSTLSFYCYPNDWSGAHTIDQETFVNVDIPITVRTQRYTAAGEPLGEASVEQKSHNYYKVQLNYGQDADANNKLLRNHLYRVRATLRTLGSSTPEVPVELDPQCTFEILDWQKITIDVNPDDLQFLVLKRNALTMANTTQDSVYFISTSPLDMATTKTRVIEAYYFDDYGRKQQVAAGEFYPTLSQSDEAGYTGYLKIASATPTNNVPKYIRISVENQQGVTDTLFVEQYPLEYFTSEQSWYSYVDDGTLGQPNSSCFSYEQAPTRNSNDDDRVYAGSGGGYVIGFWDLQFFSMVVYSTNATNGESVIYQYYYNNPINVWWHDNDWNLQLYTDWSLFGGKPVTVNLNNARIYHLYLTSTSGQHRLGIPQTDSNGYTVNTPDNNLLVSPSLMVASQLGCTKAWGNRSEVELHCKQYVEKTAAGAVYDDWRLPTRAEMDVLTYYQRPGTTADPNPSVVKQTFRAYWYWCADGPYENKYGISKYDFGSESGIDWGGYKTSQSEPAVRCVRDVKADK
ncbi:DUF1566 domain-containing protein [Alistipes sp. An31A]|uniref:fimbrial tip adhesin FimD n=1 Tax=Alistipes sp. An31A TaxID=1965631 RepID=UPI0011776024|nr:DUF1566 domain-containing protein [Alistipes sp. An31A]